MREPMTLLEQVNAFKKTNHQHLIIDRTVRQHRPICSSLNNTDNDNVELKTLSFDVYTSKHLVTNGRSMLSDSERTRLDELILPSIHKDINHDENNRRRKRKRPSYRKSLFHSYSPNSTQTDLAQITAHGIKPESQRIIPMISDDVTFDTFHCDHVPPPSPSDTEIDRLLSELQEKNKSRQPTPQTPIEKEGYIPFRLPILHQSTQFHHRPMNSSPNDIRSTLSNYLRKYY